MPPMKTRGYRQLYQAHPTSPSILHQPRGVLTQNRKGMDIAGAEKMRALLPIPLQASVGKSTSKWMAQVPAHSGQPGNAVQQGRLLQGELHRCVQKALVYGGHIPLIKSLRVCSCTHQRHLACSLQYPTAIATQLALALPPLLSVTFLALYNYLFLFLFPFRHMILPPYLTISRHLTPILGTNVPVLLLFSFLTRSDSYLLLSTYYGRTDSL